MNTLDMTDYEIPEGHKSGFVTVVGRPNVGKSTLINAFLQQKIAIVTPRPQTTRTRQLGIITRPDCQIIFIDTPGMMKPRHKLDEYMVETAVDTFEEADVVLWLIDSSGPPGPGDRAIAGQLRSLSEHVAMIVGMNKSDLLSADKVLARVEEYRTLLPKAEWLLFSALEKTGVDELLEMLVEALPEGPRLYPADQITDAFMRDIAAELIREQVMLQMRDEIPYGVAVQVDEYKERSNGLVYIHGTIIVERDAHKRILIGSKGAQLRRLGTAARREIEEMLEQKVYLELFVKIVPKWRKDVKALRRLGYSHE